MKKVMGLIVLAIMIILPMKVNAAYSIEFKKVAEDDANSTLTTEIILTVTGNSTLSQIGGQLEMKHVTLGSITVTDSKWTNVSSGNTLSFTASSSVGAGTYKIATIIFNKDGTATADDNCYVGFTACADETGSLICTDNKIEITETYICKVVNGTYYGKSGNVVTEDVYNKECVSNPQTGNFLPYIVIASGIALAVVVFTVSRRNNKLYKI